MHASSAPFAPRVARHYRPAMLGRCAGRYAIQWAPSPLRLQLDATGSSADSKVSKASLLPQTETQKQNPTWKKILSCADIRKSPLPMPDRAAGVLPNILSSHHRGDQKR